MIENAQNRQFLLCKWPQYHFLMVFMMVYINFCSLRVCQMNAYWNSTHIDVNLVSKWSKMIENTQNRQFVSCKWPQYHFLMDFKMVYIDSCSLLVCQMNIDWDNTNITVNWRQFNVKIIENTQNCQFLSCRWTQYQLLVFFTMVYISFCNLLVCQINNLYIEIVHIMKPFDVNLTYKMIGNVQIHLINDYWFQ